MDPVAIGLIAVSAYYLLKSRSKTYRFIYRKRNGSWRAYFVGLPHSRSHVLHDRDGYYVCWDRPLKNEKEARQVAQLWEKKFG